MNNRLSIYDTDPHFKIDPITRVMTTESAKVTIQQYDHRSERFTFEVPRFYEGHDLSLCDSVQVHYINIESKTKKESADVYEVDDLQLSPDSEDVVICSWLVKNTATKYAGVLAFLLKFRCLTDGKLSYEWNTAPFKNITISEGMNNGDVIAEEYSDILTKWEKELMDAGGEGVNMVEDAQNNALAEIERKKQTALAEVDNRDRALISNALKGYKSGSILALTDVSPLEHVLRVKARSETDNTNMVDISAEPVMTGENDGITQVGELVFHDKALFMQTIGYKSGEYEISCTYDTYSLIGNGVKLSLNIEDGDPAYMWGVSIVVDSSWDGLQKAYSTITVSKKDIFVNKFGANLIPYPYAETRESSKIKNGVTFTINDDTSIHIMGTPTARTYFALIGEGKANFGNTIMSAITTESATNGTYAISKRLYYDAAKKSLTLVLLENRDYNETIYPQAQFGTVLTDWEPYTKTTHPINTEDTVEDITSLYPITTLTTDTDGVVLDVEYNRDINKAFAALEAAIINNI